MNFIKSSVLDDFNPGMLGDSLSNELADIWRIIQSGSKALLLVVAGKLCTSPSFALCHDLWTSSWRDHDRHYFFIIVGLHKELRCL